MCTLKGSTQRDSVWNDDSSVGSKKTPFSLPPSLPSPLPTKVWTQGVASNDNNNNNHIQRCNSRFFAISSLRRELSPTCTLKWPRRNRVQITCNTSSAYHVQHVVLRATWYEGTAQLLSFTKLKPHLFELYFVGWIIKPMKEGRKPEYPEKTPGDELQKMPHTTAQRFKPQMRLELAQQHWWQARKADVLTVTTRVAP